MNNIKSEFSIKDLENLSGIKAHTIRIWEKRYNLFEPKRTETNIRYYTLESLQKLLNVTFLYTNGLKISKIAKLSDKEINEEITKSANLSNAENHTLNMLKLAMLNFDKALFLTVYDGLIKDKQFEDIVYEVFIPLLSEIGFLWQTQTITPAQEHFISELIVQKILINTEKYQKADISKKERVYVLFLPNNEIHDLGLRFVNYLLSKSGHHTIYLGPSVPITSLKDIQKNYKNITYVSYFTVKPERETINDYIINFKKELLDNSKNELWVLGKMTEFIDKKNLNGQINSYSTIKNLVKEI